MDRAKLYFVSETEMFVLETRAMSPQLWKDMLTKFHKFVYDHDVGYVSNLHAVIFYFGVVVGEIGEKLTFPYFPCTFKERFICNVFLRENGVWSVQILDEGKKVDEFLIGEQDGKTAS